MKMKTDIPGFERGKLHCIDCGDELTKVFLAERLIAELRTKYCTSVAYFSTHGTAESVENLQSDHSGLVEIHTDNSRPRSGRMRQGSYA